jgi:hypothetical protein
LDYPADIHGKESEKNMMKMSSILNRVVYLFPTARGPLEELV